MLENSLVLSSHGLCCLMTRIEDPRTLTVSPEICGMILQAALIFFCVPASQHAIGNYLLEGLHMFV